MTRVGFPWLRHTRLTVGRSCSKRADFFMSLRMLRYDRRMERAKR